jgi:hypothetical protein
MQVLDENLPQSLVRLCVYDYLSPIEVWSLGEKDEKRWHRHLERHVESRLIALLGY